MHSLETILLLRAPSNSLLDYITLNAVRVFLGQGQGGRAYLGMFPYVTRPNNVSCVFTWAITCKLPLSIIATTRWPHYNHLQIAQHGP